MSSPRRAVLVTGAGGFLGRSVCERLLAEGLDVHGTRRRRAPPPGVTAHALDLAEPGPLEALVRALEPSLILHMAATVDVSRDPGRFPAALADITATCDRVARAALTAGARLVVTGTCEEYGDGPAPFHEDQPPRPVSPYSAAKVAAAAWLDTLARTRGLDLLWLRPFLTYGPGQEGLALVPSALRAALAGQPFPMSTGTQTREFNFVDDMARGVVLAARSGLRGTLNLGGGPELRVIDLARRAFALAGADPGLLQVGALPQREGEAARFVGDHRRARQALGFTPEVGLDEGLRRTLEALRGAQDEPRPLASRLRVEAVTAFDDARGRLEKLRPAPVPGEVYLVRALPGQDRGHHLHRRMGEWFTPISGEGLLGVADPRTGEALWLPLTGRRVYVPAGLAHALRPSGPAPWVVLALADGPHDPEDVVPCRVPEAP